MYKDVRHIKGLGDLALSQNILSVIDNYSSFPWFYYPSIVKDVDDTFGFTHSLYRDGVKNSDFYDEFIPLIESFEQTTNTSIKEILRARVRMTLPTASNSFANSPHTDFDIPHKVFVYYINDSDGDTILYDKFRGEDISDMKEIARFIPRMGEAVMFDGLRFHSGAVPSKGRRIILNIDYIEETD